MCTATSASRPRRRAARGPARCARGGPAGLWVALLCAVFLISHDSRARAEPPTVPAGSAEEIEPPPAPLEPEPAEPETPPAISVDPKLPLDALIAVATRAFKEEQFEIAIAYLSAAYARSPLLPILFNIGQAQRKAGYTRAALATYRKFVELAPQSPLTPEANAHLAAMNAKIDAEQATREKALAERRAHDIAAHSEQLAMERTAEREHAQRELRQALLSSQPLYKRKWFWGLVSGIVASTLLVGLSVGLAPKVPPEPVGDLPTQEPRF